MLRGLALLGVLTINLFWFTGLNELTPEQRSALPTHGVDPAARFLTTLFAEGKFYSLFSLLFGVGFAVQMLRPEKRGSTSPHASGAGSGCCSGSAWCTSA